MWARAVESCLKSLVHAFCVHDHHDEKELEAIFSAVVPSGRKPSTITNAFAVRLTKRLFCTVLTKLLHLLNRSARFVKYKVHNLEVVSQELVQIINGDQFQYQLYC